MVKIFSMLELLYRDTLEFNLSSEERDQFKKTNFYFYMLAILIKLTQSECKSLKELMQCKDLVIQKAGKGNTVVITYRENYLKSIKSLLSDNSKFIPVKIDKSG